MGVTDAMGAQGRGPGSMTSGRGMQGSGKNTPRSRRGVPKPSSCNSARKAESALVFVVPGIILDKDAPGAILRCPLVIGRMGDRLLIERKRSRTIVNKPIDDFVNFVDDWTEPDAGRAARRTENSLDGPCGVPSMKRRPRRPVAAGSFPGPSGNADERFLREHPSDERTAFTWKR